MSLKFKASLIIDIYVHVWNIYTHTHTHTYSWFAFAFDVLSTVNLGRKFVGSLQNHIIDNNNEQYYLQLNSSS